MLPGLFARLRALFRPGALDRDIRAEIEPISHAMRTSSSRAGSNPADAAAEAQRLFGNVTVDRETRATPTAGPGPPTSHRTSDTRGGHCSAPRASPRRR